MGLYWFIPLYPWTDTQILSLGIAFFRMPYCTFHQGVRTLPTSNECKLSVLTQWCKISTKMHPGGIEHCRPVTPVIQMYL